jgi:predicted nucleotidyltransferase component of viral defense system
LRALLDAGVMDHLAFKGGTCLRKLIFGSAGRFSEDLDFTLDSDRPDDDVLTDLVEVFNTEHHGITFTFDEYYKTDDDTSFGGDVYYKHAWNEAGHFRMQVSLRERPTLPVVAGAMKPQAYFSHLEFELFDVRALEADEMIAEKVRAAFQRVKVRDLYDLHRFATTPFNGELLRRLAVLKLWQARSSTPRRCSRRSVAATTTGPTWSDWSAPLNVSSPLRSSRLSRAASTTCAS